MKQSWIICILWTTSIFSLSESEIKQGVDLYVKAYMKQYNASGLTLAIIKNNFNLEKGYNKTFYYGYTQRGEQIAVKESTLFRIGPLSKTFIAFALAQAIEEGKIKENGKISQYLPRLFSTPKYQGEEVNVLNLGLHTASLPLMPTLPMKTYQSLPREIDNYLRTYKLPRRPGKKYEPSDLGYALLAYALSHVGKMPYSSYLKKTVLEPLHMESTYYSMTLQDRHHLARGYQGIMPVKETFLDQDSSFFKPVHGLVSNIEDLRCWLAFFLGIKDIQLSASLKHVYKLHEISSEYGCKSLCLGWKLQPLSAQKTLMTYREGGVYHGFSSCMAFIPDTKTGVVILSNAEYELDSLANQLLILLNP